MGNVYLTKKINELLDQKVTEVGAKTKEGLVHAIFFLALTDEKFLQQAKKLHVDYFGGLGGVALEEVEEKIEGLKK